MSGNKKDVSDQEKVEWFDKQMEELRFEELQAESLTRRNAFRQELAELLEKHSADLDLDVDLDEYGIVYNISINFNLIENTMYIAHKCKLHPPELNLLNDELTPELIIDSKEV